MSNPSPPHSTLPYPPLFTDAKFVVLTDWDGTITTQDSNDYLTDNLGFGLAQRRQGNLDILAGRTCFRDGFRLMLESITANGHSYDDCKRALRENIRLDPGFGGFHAWCVEHGIPVVIVSSGMEPTIRAVLPPAQQDIPIISNGVVDNGGTDWRIQFRHPDSPFGHDKSHAILPYTRLPPHQRPTTIFFGDGVSDMSAARHADLLFVKLKGEGGENDLREYCIKEGIPHRVFSEFGEVVPFFERLVAGESVQDILNA